MLGTFLPLVFAIELGLLLKFLTPLWLRTFVPPWRFAKIFLAIGLEDRFTVGGVRTDDSISFRKRCSWHFLSPIIALVAMRLNLSCFRSFRSVARERGTNRQPRFS